MSQQGSTEASKGAGAIDSIEKVFHAMQEKVQIKYTQIIAALQVLLPQGYDFSELQGLFSNPVTNHLDYGLLIVNLLEYFIRTVSSNLVRMEEDYTVLESQTQKLEAEIRNHVKFEQTARLFMDIKLRSLDKYKREATVFKLQIQQLNARLRDAELRHELPHRNAGRARAEPKHMYQYDKAYQLEQQPEKRVVDNIRKRNRPDDKYESPRPSRIEQQAMQFNPEASNHRYHSLET